MLAATSQAVLTNLDLSLTDIVSRPPSTVSCDARHDAKLPDHHQRSLAITLNVPSTSLATYTASSPSSRIRHDQSISLTLATCASSRWSALKESNPRVRSEDSSSRCSSIPSLVGIITLNIMGHSSAGSAKAAGG
eukprot:TRINITY_DN18279_c0_g1_i1.p1 TRINITY_DN18279_c0_g1~~TRINITY_DN18279_c0_g1_i1.p1  ORF type:complete len:135 (+),score=19.58 TRINITY_DN18279_c0_g1_i1:287-691(+)